MAGAVPLPFAAMSNPVVLVHGFASSFDHNWGETGWADILRDEGRTVLGGDLLGHGRADKPTDPAAYQGLEDYVLGWAGDAPSFDAIGFSLGGRLLLNLAARDPARFGRLVVMGVGRNVLYSEGSERIAQAVESGVQPEDIGARVFAELAADPRNDRAALAAVMRRPSRALSPEDLARVTCPVLVIIGERDFAGPAQPLVEALPDASLVTIPGLDHFATPKEFRCIDAALKFLGG